MDAAGTERLTVSVEPFPPAMPLARLRDSLRRLFSPGEDEPQSGGGPDLPLARQAGSRAVIYARDKFDKDGEVVSSVAEQEKECVSYASSRGYTVVDRFLEPPTGPEDTRAELQRLRAKIWRRDIDVVIASEPERLFTDVNRLIRFARETYSLDVQLEFADGSHAMDLIEEV